MDLTPVINGVDTAINNLVAANVDIATFDNAIHAALVSHGLFPDRAFANIISFQACPLKMEVMEMLVKEMIMLQADLFTLAPYSPLPILSQG